MVTLIIPFLWEFLRLRKYSLPLPERELLRFSRLEIFTDDEILWITSAFTWNICKLSLQEITWLPGWSWILPSFPAQSFPTYCSHVSRRRIKRQGKGTRNEQVTQLSHTFITTLMKSLGDVSYNTCDTFGEMFRDKCPSRFTSYRRCTLRVCCLSKFAYHVKSLFDRLFVLQRHKVDWLGDGQPQQWFSSVVLLGVHLTEEGDS